MSKVMSISPSQILNRSLSIEYIDQEQKCQVFEEETDEDLLATRKLLQWNEPRTTKNTKNLDIVSSKVSQAIATSNPKLQDKAFMDL